MLLALNTVSQPRLATAGDVHACYETFLGRGPENLETIAHHLDGAPTVWDLIQRFYGSSEAVRRRTTLACVTIDTEQDGRECEVFAAPDELARLTDHISEVWSRYGREEAYYSVLTNPKYLSETLGTAEIEEFYNTGQLEVTGFETALLRNAIPLDADWTVLEFGCGVGRIAEPFAQRCRAYIGVDISAGHLALGRIRLRDRAIDNAALIPLGQFLSTPPRYDVFFSVIVLQHNPPPIIHQLLDHALASLNPGGLAYFQVPCHLYDYRFSVDRYLEGEGRHEHMEMHALPQRHIFALLAKHGLTPIEITPNGRIGDIGFSYGFLARKAG